MGVEGVAGCEVELGRLSVLGFPWGVVNFGTVMGCVEGSWGGIRTNRAFFKQVSTSAGREDDT